MSISIDVHESIINQINNIHDNWYIIVHNNDVTPFNFVFYVLKNVIPLNDDDAYNKTMEIHNKGKAIVYRGSKTHCIKIEQALAQIKVKSKIEPV